jgi:hypothetical protein
MRGEGAGRAGWLVTKENPASNEAGFPTGSVWGIGLAAGESNNTDRANMMLGGSNSWALRHRYVPDPGKRFKSENPAWGKRGFLFEAGRWGSQRFNVVSSHRLKGSTGFFISLRAGRNVAPAVPGLP